jgi:hypothetical protein
MKNRVVLLNTSILTTYGVFAYRPISLDGAREFAQLAAGGAIIGGTLVPTEDARADGMGPLLSAIGHQSTADVLTTLLGVSVPVNRIEYRQEPGDLAVVFKLRGRPPEGKILAREEVESIGYDFGLLVMTETGADAAGMAHQRMTRAPEFAGVPHDVDRDETAAHPSGRLA